MKLIDRQFNDIWAIVQDYVPADLAGEIRKALEPPNLDSYGLIKGQEVRYLPQAGKNHKSGKVVGVNADGSILISDDSKGYSRSIVPTNVQVSQSGPRGGSLWTPLMRERMKEASK